MSFKQLFQPRIAPAHKPVAAHYAANSNERVVKSDCCKDRELRDSLSEKQIDKMISDSFPASDPPSTY